MSKVTFSPLNDWGIFPAYRPCIIAGPCSAETYAGLLETATALPEGAVLRAGAWKPRTRPDSFEGAGTEALDWMVRVREKTGRRIATEVASAAHVRACLEREVDILWIGARTTTNPFLVQEIADALKGHPEQIVLVKNPVSPEVELWDGAIERLMGAGLRKIGAVSRGFSVGAGSAYRNTPMWQVPIELRRRHREMAFFCDPSHIAGDRKYIAEISQKALNLGYDGLMIETHCNPDEALSDSSQQITPDRLREIIASIKTRNTGDGAPDITLEALRTRVDELDETLIKTLAERFRTTDKIGIRKSELNLTSLQMGRWSEVLSRAVKTGAEEGLGEEFITRIFSLIHEESVASQDKLR